MDRMALARTVDDEFAEMIRYYDYWTQDRKLQSAAGHTIEADWEDGRLYFRLDYGKINWMARMGEEWRLGRVDLTRTR